MLKDELFQAVIEFLRVFEDVGIEIVLPGVRQGIPVHALIVIKRDVSRLYQENDIGKIRIEAAIQIAEGNTVWVSNEDFQIPKFPDTNDAFFTSLWEWDKSIQWNGFGANL